MNKIETQEIERFRIGGLCFLGRKPAYAHLRRVLNNHKVGDILNRHEDVLFRDVVKRHPRAKEKIGAGIDHFVIERGTRGTLGIKIVRVDKSEDDLSIKKCIYGNDTHRRRVLRAMRRGVSDDIADLRRQWYDRYRHGNRDGVMRCALSGRYIPIEQGHMDHIPPMTFEVLALTFLAHKSVGFDQIEFGETGLHEEERLADSDLEDEFRQWHANLAQLRFIADNQNHYDEELVRIRRNGLSINADARGLRSVEQSDVQQVLFSEA
ncbi:DCL family protein [Pseudosulfitobacter pseudonitzschiae]|uniref:DCL family protein n=1 Tax=Pseudosulfitobacter pseudonitzschiae TaxID=1402135 RepID=UPI003B766E17